VSDTEYRAKRGYMRKRKWKEKIIGCALSLRAKREPQTTKEVLERQTWERLYRIIRRRYE